MNKPTTFANLPREHGVAPQAAPPGEKPRVLVAGSEYEDQRYRPGVFYRSSRPRTSGFTGVDVVVVAEQDTQSLPTVQILQALPSALGVEKHADLFIHVKGGPTPAVMSEDTAKAILESSVAKEVLPT